MRFRPPVAPGQKNVYQPIPRSSTRPPDQVFAPFDLGFAPSRGRRQPADSGVCGTVPRAPGLPPGAEIVHTAGATKSRTAPAGPRSTSSNRVSRRRIRNPPHPPAPRVQTRCHVARPRHPSRRPGARRSRIEATAGVAAIGPGAFGEPAESLPPSRRSECALTAAGGRAIPAPSAARRSNRAATDRPGEQVSGDPRDGRSADPTPTTAGTAPNPQKADGGHPTYRCESSSRRIRPRVAGRERPARRSGDRAGVGVAHRSARGGGDPEMAAGIVSHPRRNHGAKRPADFSAPGRGAARERPAPAPPPPQSPTPADLRPHPASSHRAGWSGARRPHRCLAPIAR